MPLSPLELPVSSHAPRPPRNRRRSVRVRGAFGITVQGDKSPWRGLDLSSGGMLCVAREPVWPGNKVRATLKISDQPAMSVQGEVVELVPYGDDVAMRVCFAPLDTEQRAQLSSLMLKLEKLS